ncbi:MAG: DUF3179 domain-containing (seleno)protein [Phycisphaeraceae bacterium]
MTEAHDRAEPAEGQAAPRQQSVIRTILTVGVGLVAMLVVINAVLVVIYPGYVFYDQRRPDWRGAPMGDPHGSAIWDEDGVTWLWGGAREGEAHFDISNLTLKEGRFKYGLGREAFSALVSPRFVSVDEAHAWLPERERVLLVEVNGEARIYPVGLLVRHEVVNDRVGGVPVFAAYCILADLGAVYDRRYGGQELTFAVSGYTYAQRGVWGGLDAFVLWDRDTESLWWPLVGKAVAGALVDTPLALLDESHWSQTTYAAARGLAPHARVLDDGQWTTWAEERPKEWDRLDLASIEAVRSGPGPLAVAPRWGENGVTEPSPEAAEVLQVE